MAQQLQTHHDFSKFCYQKVELFKTESIGIGSYGIVCKAMCDDLLCAAKILHPTIFQFTAPGTESAMRKFEQECRLLSAINHPHIVQYLGTYRDAESSLPVLLMELMDESLTRFLKRSHKPLPYHIGVNLSHDIALALSYLNSNGIVHRDLSSNNVLLDRGSRAKVTDFGMVKLYDVNHSTAQHTPLTLCPGTVVYMSPEALSEPPLYTDKLGSFSLGVLCIQIMTRQLPDPGNRFKIIEVNDPRAPSGKVQVEVPEVERRKSHISLIEPAHPLLTIALDCLRDTDRERPSCHELCSRMSVLKLSPTYAESEQASQMNTPGAIRKTETEIQQFEQIQQQLYTLNNQLHNKEKEELDTREEKLVVQDHEKKAAIGVHKQEIQQLKQQLRSSEQTTAEFQQKLEEKEKIIQAQQRQIEELQQQLRQNLSQGVEASTAARNVKLTWRNGGEIPHRMYGEVTVVDGNVAYFRPGRPSFAESVIAYDSANNEWSRLPKCPNRYFSLAIVNSLVTAIGGETKFHKATDSLLSLTENKWTEQFAPMPTKRWSTAAVCTGKTLIVAGGSNQDKHLCTVELMNTETLQWSASRNLPHPVTQATATVCGNNIYMLGGFDQSGKPSNSAFISIFQSSKPHSSRKTLSACKLWHKKLANVPVAFSTCASLDGQLITVGGCNSNGTDTTAIHKYNTTTNSWDVISHMATPRHRCLVAVLPRNKLMVVGGGTNDCVTNSVEIGTIAEIASTDSESTSL